MMIHLPDDVECSIQAAVRGGRFASLDDAMTVAAQLLLKEIERGPSAAGRDSGLGFIGALRDDADLLDQAVEHAMRVREERPWRLTPIE